MAGRTILNNIVPQNGGATLSGLLVANGASPVAAAVASDISSAIDLIGSTRGSLLYRGVTAWAIVAPGTSGYALLSAGAGADPAYGPVVTSVGLALPSIFTISGSPVTTTGTLTGTLAVQNANKVFAGPATGADAAPTFRALVAADLPAGTTPTGANPTANIGFTAVNGSAATFMRSDAAPALPQAIILSRIFCHC